MGNCSLAILTTTWYAGPVLLLTVCWEVILPSSGESTCSFQQNLADFNFEHFKISAKENKIQLLILRIRNKFNKPRNKCTSSFKTTKWNCRKQKESSSLSPSLQQPFCQWQNRQLRAAKTGEQETCEQIKQIIPQTHVQVWLPYKKISGQMFLLIHQADRVFSFLFTLISRDMRKPPW